MVAREGMTLQRLDGLLASQGLRVNRYHGDRLSLPQLPLLLRLALADPGDRLLANYDRSALGQKGSGHISPLAAYDSRPHSVLILVVAVTATRRSGCQQRPSGPPCERWSAVQA